MNRGHILQSLAVQQMNMAGNPNWWNINNNMKAPNNHQELLPCPSSSLMFPHHLPSSPSLPLRSTGWSDNQDLPESWSQLLLGGIVGEEERSGVNQFQAKKIQNWEDGEVMYTSSAADVKHEIYEGVYVYCHGNNEEFQATIRPKWSNNIIAVSSPKSSAVATFSGNNMLDFSNNNADGKVPQPQHSSESKSTATGGGALKKARVQSSSAPATFKVRKEKLGDRISTLHQIVSPFGKTDTASVLLETIGYIRFLQSQIEALSNPYLGNASSGNMRQQQQLLQSVQGEISCLFPDDSGQLITDNCLKRKVAPGQVTENEPKMDLKSRGLCLVPVSSTLHVGSSNGADYWAPTLGGGFR